MELVSTDGQVAGLPASYTFTTGDGGTHTFTNVALDTAGSQSITATDSADSAVTGTSPEVEVIPAAASQMLIVSGPLTLAAGSRGPVLLQFEDAYGNAGATSPVAQTIDLATTSSAGAFYAVLSGGTATTSISVPAGHSSATFYYADTLVGTPTVTASAPWLGADAARDDRASGGQPGADRAAPRSPSRWGAGGRSWWSSRTPTAISGPRPPATRRSA